MPAAEAGIFLWKYPERCGILKKIILNQEDGYEIFVSSGKSAFSRNG